MAAYPPPTPPPFQFDPREQRRWIKNQERARRDAQRFMLRQAVLQRQQARGLRRSSILGPIILVAIGVVLLLVRTGKLPAFTFATWYGRFWPLMLVAAGLVLLAEWVFDQNRPTTTGVDGTTTVPVRRGIGGGVIFLLILLAIIGACMSTVHDGRFFLANGFSINPDNLSEFFGEKHDLPPETFDQPFAAGTSLNVDDPHGDVSVSGTSTDGQLHLILNKQVYSSDSETDRRSSDLSPHMVLNGNVLTLTVASVNGGVSDLTITVPPSAPVFVNANHGSITLTNLRYGVNVTANRGDVDLKQISGGVLAHVNHSGSSFTASDITGDLSLHGHADDLNVQDISGQVSLEGDFFGDTHLERIHGPVLFQTSRTHFSLARVDGNVEINSSDISGSQLVGPIDLRVRSRNISFDRISGDVNLSNSNGSVDLTSATPMGNLTIDNSNGAVNLTIPTEAALVVDAETKGGDIENDLALTPTRSKDRTSIQGSVGTGGTQVHLHTTHADIDIHRGAVAPPIQAPMPAETPAAPSIGTAPTTVPSLPGKRTLPAKPAKPEPPPPPAEPSIAAPPTNPV